MVVDFCGLQWSIGPNSVLLDLWHLAPLTGDLRCDGDDDDDDDLALTMRRLQFRLIMCSAYFDLHYLF